MKTKIKKPRSQAKYRQDCVKIAKIIAKERDGWKCQQCGRSKQQGWQIHGSHVFPEGKFHGMSIDPTNIEALCAVCHMLWHEHPIQGVERFRSQNQALYDILRVKSQKIIKLDYKKELERLKLEFKSLNQNKWN